MIIDPSVLWWLLALGLGLAELFTGTFFLLFLALGAAVAGVVAYMGFGFEWQLLAAAVGAVAGAFWLRARQKSDRPNAHESLDVGGRVTVAVWTSPTRTEVRYRGATWQVELEPGQGDGESVQGQPGEHFIRQVNGNVLIVAPAADR